MDFALWDSANVVIRRISGLVEFNRIKTHHNLLMDETWFLPVP
jgi:hypothetical protein